MGRTSLLALAAIVLGAGTAGAADVLVAPRATVAPGWAGFYLGVHGGHGWKRNDFEHDISIATLENLGGINSKGWLVGGHAGHNWQFGSLMAGLEIDFSASRIRGTSDPLIQPFAGQVETNTEADDVKWLGSARARLGYVPFDSVMVYGTAGLAWERLNRTLADTTTTTDTLTIANTFPRDWFGWVAGAGVEAKLFGSRNWIGRLEYLHYDFGVVEDARRTTSTASPIQNSADRAGAQTIDVVRAGVSYLWTPGGLSVASASMPLKAAPSVAAAQTWAGFYLGIHGGHGWKRNDFKESRFPASGISSKGRLVGGHAGHNWQFGSVVTGLEIDFSASLIHGTSNPRVLQGGGGFSQTRILEDDVKWLGTARARLGYTPFDSIMVYGTAGLAWERVDRTTTTATTSPGDSFTSIRTIPLDWFGWVAGAGMEARLSSSSSSWIGRLEYLHYNFGAVEVTARVTSTAPSPNFADSGGTQTIDVVRAGVSYLWTPEVVAGASASLPLKAPRSVVVAPNWAGFYLGAHGGHGWKRNDFTRIVSVTPLETLGGINSHGWLAGGHAGHNWQFGSVVAGLEIDFSASRIRGTSDTGTLVGGGSLTITTTADDDVKWLGTARARLGYAPFSTVMVYGTAGLAWERVNRTENTTLSAPLDTVTVDTTPRDWFGWVAGAGVEARLFGSSNWIGRLEYLHYDFGTVEFTNRLIASVPTDSFAESHGSQTIDVVRVGVSYLFCGACGMERAIR